MRQRSAPAPPGTATGHSTSCVWPGASCSRRSIFRPRAASAWAGTTSRAPDHSSPGSTAASALSTTASAALPVLRRLSFCTIASSTRSNSGRPLKICSGWVLVSVASPSPNCASPALAMATMRNWVSASLSGTVARAMPWASVRRSVRQRTSEEKSERVGGASPPSSPGALPAAIIAAGAGTTPGMLRAASS